MTLLKWALIFLVVSLIAALFGFTGISAASADIARVLFFIFLVIFVVLLILGLMAGSQGLTTRRAARVTELFVQRFGHHHPVNAIFRSRSVARIDLRQ